MSSWRKPLECMPGNTSVGLLGRFECWDKTGRNQVGR